MSGSRLRPRKTPVQPRARETRDRILGAAARVFSRHGYAAGTTNRIAAEAGLSIGSLYQYFPNKDAILVALVRQHVVEGAAAVGDAAVAAGRLAPDDLAGRVALVVDAFVDVHARDPALHQVLFEEAPRPPELLAELRALEDEAVAVAADVLGDALPARRRRWRGGGPPGRRHRRVARPPPRRHTAPADRARRGAPPGDGDGRALPGRGRHRAEAGARAADRGPRPDGQDRRSSNRSVEK